jgi:hypothetical protein
MREESRSGLLRDFHGIILVDKASGKTSYDLIREMKKVFF